jgi:small-conductance mechanosensitive channel
MNAGKDLRCPICNPKIACPHCGKEAEAYWLICPYCEGVLSEKSAQSKHLARLNIFLQVCGGLSLIILVLTIGALLTNHEYVTFSVWVIGIALLTAVSVGISAWQTLDRPHKRTVNRYLGNFLLVLGILTTSSCLLGITYFLYLWATCYCNSPSGPPMTGKKGALQNVDKVSSDPSDKEPKE